MLNRRVNLHAIEQTQLRRQHRVDGVRRPKFDYHTDVDLAHVIDAAGRKRQTRLVREREGPDLASRAHVIIRVAVAQLARRGVVHACEEINR